MFKKELIGLGLPVIADPTLRFFITFLFIKKRGNRVLISGVRSLSFHENLMHRSKILVFLMRLF